MAEYKLTVTTDDKQEQGLAYAVGLVNAERLKQVPQPPLMTHEEYLVSQIDASVVQAVVVSGEARKTRFADAYDKASDQEKQAAEAVLKIDLSAAVSAEEVKP